MRVPKPFLATPLHPWPASLRQRTVHVQPGMQWDFWVGLSSGVWGAVHAPNALPSSTHRHTCLLRSPGFDPHLLPSEMSPFPQNGCWEEPGLRSLGLGTIASFPLPACLITYSVHPTTYRMAVGGSLASLLPPFSPKASRTQASQKGGEGSSLVSSA